MLKINQINEQETNSKNGESKGYVIDNKASGSATGEKTNYL